MKIMRENYKIEEKKLLGIRRWQTFNRIKGVKTRERRQTVINK